MTLAALVYVLFLVNVIIIMSTQDNYYLWITVVVIIIIYSVSFVLTLIINIKCNVF